MVKKLMMLMGLFCVGSLFAAITIDPATRTFDKAGGANSVLTAGDGSWTASADVDWITISPRTSGSAGESCVYIVNSNFSADTRVGRITIDGKTHTVTQTGYPASLSATSANFTKTGGTGTVDITVDNNISWTARSNDPWITLVNSTGYGAGTITYEIAPYTTSVVARSGSITIGGITFVVVQSGPQVTIVPAQRDISHEATVLLIPVNALSVTTWMPASRASWITLVDAGSCVGDGTMTLAVSKNDGWIPRTGVVTVGDATLTISQSQSPTFNFAIDPVNATADPKGAYGKVNVIAPSDSPWVAESRASWITISSGENGAGNGTVGYVASANPTTSERTGQIRMTPKLVSPDPDLTAGLIWWITESSNIEGNESRSATRYLSSAFNGSADNVLTGTAIPAKDQDDFTLAFSFKVGELARINRLLQLGDASFYLDNDNRLVYNSTKSDFAVENTDTWYSLVINQTAAGRLTIYAGVRDALLTNVLTVDTSSILSFASSVAMSNFNFGYAKLPTVGYLTSGAVANLRFWTRALTERESVNADLLQSRIFEDAVKYEVDGVAWNLFPLDGNCYGTKSSDRNPARNSYVSQTGWSEFADRFGLRQKAICSTGSATLTLSCLLYHIFTSSKEPNATMAFWLYVRKMPASDVQIFRRGSSGGYGYVGLALKPDGSLVLSQRSYSHGNTSTTFSGRPIVANEWCLITVVGTDQSNIRVYVDDTEVGNVTSDLMFGYYVDSNYTSSSYNASYNNITFGGWDGALDELSFYHEALTSAQIRSLYAASRVQEIYHTVTQGIVEPEFDKTELYVPAAGEVLSVNLTLPANVNWTAQSNTGWIVIPTGYASGVGSAEISLNVTANPSVLERNGTVTIAGKTISVHQRGLASSLSYDNQLIGTDGGSGNVEVYTEGSAAWTAVSDVSWISIATGASGSGNGSVMYVVDPYTMTSASRTGTITIAGKKLYITQRGYDLSIDPAVTEIGCNAGQGEFGISASLDVVWTALITVDWITIVGDKTGNGDGTLHYSVAPNNTGAARTGKIIVSGEEYTITQLSTLAVTTSVKGHGVVSGGGGYKQGDEAVLRATPDAGYAFSCWTGDATGTNNPIVVAIDGSKFVTATFVPIAVENAAGSAADTAKVVLSWTELPWANTYRIYRAADAKKPNTVFVTLPQGSSSYNDTSVGPGETYYYWIEAVSDDSLSCTDAIAGTRAVMADVTVHFDANGGTGEMDDLAFASGIPRTLTACAFIRTGYTFVGWARAPQGSIVFTDRQSVTDPGVGNESNVTLYAQWAANVYSVKFSANGGSGEMSDQSFTYDTAQALTVNRFSNGDNDFIGWATVANGSVVYYDQQSVKNLIAKAGGIVYLYAVWGADIPTYGPWGESDAVKNPDKLGPTYLMNMPLTILGETAQQGDCVAVYRQDTNVLCGLGKVLDESGTLTLVCYAPTGVTLHFKVWQMSSGVTNPQIYDCDAKCDLIAPASGAFLTGHSLSVSDKVDLTLTLKWSDDWHIISFNVEPDDTTPAAVFGEVADKIQAVTQGIEFWMPGMTSSLSEIQVGKAYWVKATQDSVTWTVSGRVKADTAIQLEEGWNLIGYTPEKAGNISAVLATALAANAIDFITYGVDFYPGVLTKMEPGKGYWVHATKAYTLRYDESAAASLASARLLSAPSPRMADVSMTYGPWGAGEAVKNPDKLGPTCLRNMPLTIRDQAAQVGDCVAVFREDTDELCGLGQVLDDSGEVTAVCYAPETTRLRFKAYSRSAGKVIDCDSASVFTVKTTGAFVDGHRLVAEDRLVVPGVTVAGRPLKVEANWVSGELVNRYGAGKASQFVKRFGSDLSSAMLRSTGKFGPRGEALNVWHDYIAGTDPTDVDSRFSAKIGFRNGKPHIEWEPKLTDAEAAKRTYTTYGKESLSDSEWTPVTDATAEGYRFFKVGIEMK